MSRDAMPILLTVRRRAVDQARSALGLCLREEAELEERLHILDETMQRQRQSDDRFPDRVYLLDILAAGLQRARAERDALLAALEPARTRTALARTAVADARLAAEAVEQLIDERKAAAATRAEAQAQHALDDIVGLLRARNQAVASQNARTGSSTGPLRTR